jgi:hypothetical protein
MRGAGLLVVGDLDGYAVRTSLLEQDGTRFLSPRCFRCAHNLRDGVNQSQRIVF